MQPESRELCPACGQDREALVHLEPSTIDHLLSDVVRQRNPSWKPAMGICRPCLDRIQSHVKEMAQRSMRGEGAPGEVEGYKVLPTPWRLFSHPDFTGCGVTICCIDSGFFPHPDLVYPRNRIAKILDITHPRRRAAWFSTPHATSWHGTMTTVVMAGSGYLSGGWYRGIASEARLVLLKVADDEGRIAGEHIVQALQWVLKHHQREGIRIVNLSITDDWPQLTSESPVNQAVEALSEAGVVVVAAVGNDPAAPVRPPASAPSAIAVGGLDDRNSLDPEAHALYHSTAGQTLDAVWKPELVAPAIWLAAPILPGTPQQDEAAALYFLWKAEDWRLRSVLAHVLPRTDLPPELLEEEPPRIRATVADRIRAQRYISPHYQHADGTSFAAPIVCSVVAQMLQADSTLDVPAVRGVLLAAARPLPEGAAGQGHGVMRPLQTLNRVVGRKLRELPPFNPDIDYRDQRITFHFLDRRAAAVALSGDWNGWSSEALPFEPGDDGHWELDLPIPPPGDYRYKIVVDGATWRCDPRNLHREPDGLDGFNSTFVVEEPPAGPPGALNR